MPTVRTRARQLVLAAVVLSTAILTPVADTAVAQAQTVKVPVVVLHGITGSFLRSSSGEVWPKEGETARSLSDDHLDVLRLRADGRTPASTSAAYQVSVDRGAGLAGVIDQVELCVLGACAGVSDVYSPLFEHFQGRGYRLGVDVVPFAFDWRLDTRTNATLLLAEIDRVRARTGAGRVDVVAHSQGGLVTQAALTDPRSAGKVRRVATLGTPVLGATQFLGVLEYREPCLSLELLGGCILNRERAQQLVTNWPGALALLPSPGYYQAYGSPIDRLVDDNGDGRNTGLLPPTEVRNRLADRNLTLVDQATTLHRSIDAWAPADPSVQLTRFVGTGLGTIERVEEYRKEQCSGTLWWRKCTLVDASRMQFGDGDGTVARHAADVHDPAIGLDLRGSGTNRYVNVGHSDLVTDAGVLTAVTDYLIAPPGVAPGTTTVRTTSTTSSGVATLSGAPTPAGSRVGAPTAGGATAVAPPLSGLEITADGPVALEVVDRAGRRAGSLDIAAAPIVQDIPGSTAAVGADGASAILTERGRYGATLLATAAGDVTVRLTTHGADGATETRSVGPVHVVQGARLTFDAAVPLRRSTVQVAVDDDGDGRTDRRERVRPPTGPDAADERIAPEASVSLKPVTGPGGEDLVEITIAATDEGGSGVARVDYAIDTAVDAAGFDGVYNGPFLAPAEGLLHVRAVDGAGNVMAPYLRVPLR